MGIEGQKYLLSRQSKYKYNEVEENEETTNFLMVKIKELFDFCNIFQNVKILSSGFGNPRRTDNNFFFTKGPLGFLAIKMA